VSDPAVARGRNREHFRSMGFELHYRNMRLMTGEDIVMPSLGGSGASLLGNIVLELGLHYVDLTKETLLLDGSSRAPTDPITRRIRGDRFAGGDDYLSGCTRRFMKTHLPAEEFIGYPMGGLWMLVRDPRDALYSWYRYHRGFATQDWERVPDSFEEFLRAPFFTGEPPVAGWTSFYSGWCERAKSCPHVRLLRFEDLKACPLKTIRDALGALDLRPPNKEIQCAVKRSSFQTMRGREDAVAPPGNDARVMRSGQANEWREWMTPRLASYFSGDAFGDVARGFGYDIGMAA
jgi:hypothetical protein